MPTRPKPAGKMTGAQYLAAIDALGLNITDAGRFLKVSPRTGRRYAVGEAIPHGIAMLLRLMVARKITPKELGQ